MSSKCFLLCRVEHDFFSKAGLGNVRPAGHMRPAKHLNVARDHFLKVDMTFKMPLETLLLRKWTAKSKFFFLKRHQIGPYCTYTGPHLPIFVSNVARKSKKSCPSLT